MFFFSSIDGQMTWNAFKAWLMTDEAAHSLEDLLGRMHGYELERWLRDEDSLKRRERIARKCIACAKNDEYLRDRYIFRGDAGDAVTPSDYKCLRVEEPFRVVLDGIEFGRLVDNLPGIDIHLSDVVELDQASLEERRIVRGLFKSFVEGVQGLYASDYSSVMLGLESLPCAYHKVKKYQRWFVISYSHSDDQRSNYLPWAYKTVQKAKEAVKRLAEHIVPRDWDRCKIVIDDGAATITKLENPHQGGSAQRQMEIRLQVERESVSVPKDRLIPIDNPPVKDWMVARTKDWAMRDLTMEQWLEKLNPMNFEGSGAERSLMSERYAMKCDWWKFDFTRLESWEWVLVLRHRPDLIDKCPVVDVFSDWDWCLLLRRQPRFADRFDRWEVLPPDLWCFLLRRQPRFSERFTGWDELEAHCWRMLLKDQPQFSDRCPWNMLSGYDWKELLIVRPEFESHCDWEKLSGWDWKELLIARPEYAGNCDKWETIGADEWCELLQARPEFQDKCDWEHFHWDEVSEERWAQLIERQPQFLEKAGEDAAVWSKMSTANWVKILGSYPELRSTCEQQFSNWEGLTVDVFVRLITLAPGLANRCDWPHQWNADEQVKLLVARPEVEPHICFTAFSKENWVAALTKIPTLANKCDWNVFSEEELVSIVDCQKSLIDFVPRGSIVSRRFWIDLSKRDDGCKQRFLQELNIDTLDGRAITDMLQELPELAEQLPTERIVDEIDKKRLALLQEKLADRLWGDAVSVGSWGDCELKKLYGKDGIVLCLCVKGDLFSVPKRFGQCGAIVVKRTRSRQRLGARQIGSVCGKWAECNPEVPLKQVKVPGSEGEAVASDVSLARDQNQNVAASLGRAFSELPETARAVAVYAVKYEREEVLKALERWFKGNSSRISVLYLFDDVDENVDEKGK